MSILNELLYCIDNKKIEITILDLYRPWVIHVEEHSKTEQRFKTLFQSDSLFKNESLEYFIFEKPFHQSAIAVVITAA